MSTLQLSQCSCTKAKAVKVETNCTGFSTISTWLCTEIRKLEAETAAGFRREHNCYSDSTRPGEKDDNIRKKKARIPDRLTLVI